MKRTLFFICTLLCANVILAQEWLATLKHNDTISVFYGQNAFVNAHNAAADGDTITLSDGEFNSCTITKNITLRGNGAIQDTTRNCNGTYFRNTIRLDGVSSFNAEGINFSDIYTYDSPTINLRKCIVTSMYRMRNQICDCINNAYLVNCIVTNMYTRYAEGLTFINSVIRFTHYSMYSGTYIWDLPNATAINCIMIGGGDSTLDKHYYNCILVNPSGNEKIGMGLNNNILCGFGGLYGIFNEHNEFMSVSEVFDSWNGSTISSNPETYRLIPNFSSPIYNYDANDVGIFGGEFPFDFTPSYSVIRDINIGTRTNENEELEVEIELLTE